MRDMIIDEKLDGEKMVYTVSDIKNMLGIGRDAAYRLCRSGKFRTVKVGNSILVSKVSFHRWLDEI